MPKAIIIPPCEPCKRELAPNQFNAWMTLLRTTSCRKLKGDLMRRDEHHDPIEVCAYGAQYLKPDLLRNGLFVSQFLPLFKLEGCDTTFRSITQLNDETNLSLAQIADVIEQLTIP